jgi:hypothetical protein
MVVTVLFKDGDQLPVMPLVEVVGKGDNVAPEQMAATGLKAGDIFGLTLTVTVAVPVQPVTVPVMV